MSLLNRPSDGIHSCLVTIFKLLLQEGPLDKDRVIALCAPDGLCKPDYVRQTLNTWLGLGLFVDENDRIAISKEISNKDRSVSSLPRLARAIVLKTKNNANFWNAESAGSADFTRSVAWLLAQDVYRLEFSSGDKAQTEMRAQLAPGFLLLQNNTRWDGLKAWAPFLGFGWSSRFPQGALVPDPTVAIKDALPFIFNKKGEIPARSFLDRLAQEVPVLDGGTYRTEVEQHLREGPENSWSPLSGLVSTSTSRAIMRLVKRRILSAENRSDAPERVRLAGRDKTEMKVFSHFLLNTKIS